ncbi:MAG: hypothetical protein GY775_17365 [Candidatus Scalindua sp.]|nr:hypothetical protein [Candidatus Scalindua sp.]
MTEIIEVLKYILSIGAVITLFYKLGCYMTNRVKKDVKEERTVSDLCMHVKELETLIKDNTSHLQDHEVRISSNESSHENVLIKIQELSLAVESFRKENTTVIGKLIDTLKSDRLKE